MRLRTRQVLATAAAAWCLASIALGVVAAFAIHLKVTDLALVPAFVAFAAAGWVLAVKRPDNIVGLLVLMATFGFMFIPWGIASEWGIRHHVAHAAAIAAAGQTSFVFDVGGLALLLPLFFPEGRLPSTKRRWRLAVAVDLAYMFLVSFNLFVPGTVSLPSGAKIDSPIAIASLEPLWSTLIAIAAPLFLIGIVSSIAAVVVRWRCADADRRAQMKWVLLALLFVPPAFVLHDWAQSVSNVMLTIVLPLVPLSIAVSVLRYRLYDIDRIVSRTVSYLLVTGMLVAAYVGCVAITTSLLHVGSSFGVAASTLAAAALFRPVLRRVRTAVDRRFNRARYDAVRTVDAFSLRLRDEVDLSAVREDLLAVVTTTMQPSHASLWVTG